MSASTARRRSTVHDFSSLRLHPDGSRVAIHSPARVDLRDSRIRNTGRDARGNRVARDAAGLGAVPKRIVMRKDDDDDNDDNDDNDGEDIEIRKTKPRMPLRRKRRRIDEDVEFLGDSRNSARCTADAAIVKSEESMNWPVPSSVRYPADFFFFYIRLPYHSYIGLAEMRALLCEPVLCSARSAVRSVAAVQT
jgi:hypothetical protein